MAQQIEADDESDRRVTRRTLVKGIAASSVSVVLAGCEAAPGGDDVDVEEVTPGADGSGDGGTGGGNGSGDDEPGAGGGRQVAMQIEEYPRARVASLAEVGSEPVQFDYPLEGQSNFAVKLGESARGGVGPDGDVVAFTYTCSHMGCSLEGAYNDEHSMLGACPCHLSRFDLTNHGMVITGHATQSLPQVTLEVEDGDVYATGVLGLVYGYHDNLEDGTPSAVSREALGIEEPAAEQESGGGEATAGGGSNSGPEFDGWFENVDNFDGVVDRTGQDTVEVTVGSQANGGAFGFAPPAVRVSTGTTVVWEWTGEGGQHNVVAEGGGFESALTTEAGHTFEHTFDSAGTFPYVCRPHGSLGMKGAVVVEG